MARPNHERQIIVIDDDNVNREIVERALKEKGYSENNIISTDNSTHGLLQIDQLTDAIILDGYPNGPSGITFLNALHNNGEYHKQTESRLQPYLGRIPVVMFSGTPELEPTAMQAGADRFIHKPGKIDDILVAIDELILGRSKKIEHIVEKNTARSYIDRIGIVLKDLYKVIGHFYAGECTSIESIAINRQIPQLKTATQKIFGITREEESSEQTRYDIKFSYANSPDKIIQEKHIKALIKLRFLLGAYPHIFTSTTDPELTGIQMRTRHKKTIPDEERKPLESLYRFEPVNDFGNITSINVQKIGWKYVLQANATLEEDRDIITMGVNVNNQTLEEQKEILREIHKKASKLYRRGFLEL